MKSRERPDLKLTGEDGNAFAIIGRANQVARKAGWSKDEIMEYNKEVMNGNYDHLLAVTMKYFNVF